MTYPIQGYSSTRKKPIVMTVFYILGKYNGLNIVCPVANVDKNNKAVDVLFVMRQLWGNT